MLDSGDVAIRHNVVVRIFASGRRHEAALETITNHHPESCDYPPKKNFASFLPSGYSIMARNDGGDPVIM